MRPDHPLCCLQPASAHLPPASLAPTGRKDDAAKTPYHLLPWGPVTDIAQVLEYGARKYSPDNWQSVPQPRRRYFSAAIRHLLAWWSGEKLDPESSLPHLAHAACCLLFLAWFDIEKKP